MASSFQSIVRRGTSIRDAIRLMGSRPENNYIAGIAVVVDAEGRVEGVLTDGDIRRALSRDVSIDQPVEKIANFDPITVDRRLSPRFMRQAVVEKARRRNRDYRRFDKIVVLDEDGRLFDVIRLADILTSDVADRTIAVYGLGFAGLTLAATLANAGIAVVGVDKNPELIAGLRRGTPPFYENGLDLLLLSLADSNPFRLSTAPGEWVADIHIIAVGTPIGEDSKPDLTAIREISTALAKVLKRGDTVIVRSTVPVGTTRNVVLPLLQADGLAAGRDFHLAFAPERTAAGRALEELKLLPQIVGGFDQASVQIAGRVFSEITNTIVEVTNIEAAELVKLMNNTFRDLVFSFANEAAYLCDAFNLDAFRLIQAANEGYPRNPIPLPSPGVSGFCLSKDPHLYSHPVADVPFRPTLGEASRAINRKGALYVLSKLRRFCTVTGLNLEDLRILLLGLAFKGMPETSDYRNSVSVELLKSFPRADRIMVKDFVVAPSEIAALGYAPVDDVLDAARGADAILVMNNHYANSKFNVVQALRNAGRPIFFFDGWHMFDQHEIEALGGVTYATMGYMTDRGSA